MKAVAMEIAKLNTKLLGEKKPYVLIGIGRWGSLDAWLGIPVTWDQIAGAAAIVESGFKDFEVEPSQGSHFFQNITSFRVGYFTVDAAHKIGFIDWEWLLSQKAIEELNFAKHLQLKEPISVRINGHKNIGIFLSRVFKMINDFLLKEELPNIDLLFGQLWEISVDGMRLIDEDGKILLVNDAYCRIFQMEKDYLLGKPFSIVYDRDEQEDALRTFREDIRNNKFKTLFER